MRLTRRGHIVASTFALLLMVTIMGVAGWVETLP